MTFARDLVRLALVGSCGLVAASAAAQPRTARPPQPGLRTNGSIYGGYDAPIFTNNATATFQPTGQVFTGGDVRMNYNRPGQRVTMGFSGSAANRYYPNFTPSTAPSYGASFTINSISRGRWQWNLAQFVQYAPLSAASLLASTGGGVIGGGPIDPSTLAAAGNLQISTIRQVDFNTTGQVSYSMRRRTHLSLLSGLATQKPLDSPQPSALRVETRLRLSQELTRNLRGFIGYGLNQLTVPAQSGAPSYTARIDSYDFGVDFARPFQLTRDTSVGFQTGFVKVPNTGRSEFQVVGAVTLDHRVSRRWDAQFVATRDARFVQAYRNPVVFAGLSASIGGQLAGRVSAGASANYSSGQVNVSPTNLKFNSTSASVQTRFDIKRAVGVYIDYSLFRSTFDVNQAVVGLPSGSFGRHGVRVGLSFGLNPFMRRP
jgi:hypothetical protein